MGSSVSGVTNVSTMFNPGDKVQMNGNAICWNAANGGKLFHGVTADSILTVRKCGDNGVVYFDTFQISAKWLRRYIGDEHDGERDLESTCEN